MRIPRVVPLLIAIPLLALGAIAAACGDGGDELSTEDYFQQLQTTSDDVNSRFETLFEQFGPAFDPSASEEELLDAAPQLAGGFASILSDAYDQANDLSPPSEVEDAHNEFVAAIGDLRDATRGLEDRAAEIESAAEVEALFENAEVNAADERVNQACRALEQLAADNGFELSLECEDEE